MSVLFARHRRSAPTGQFIPARPNASGRGPVTVSREDALRSSAVWAARRLRADLLSTLPLDVFTRIDGIQYERPRPRILEQPGGPDVDRLEWLYSSQSDLDTYGNAFGLITERDGAGRPARIDLIPADQVAVRRDKNGTVTYRFNSKTYARSEVWHERQYTVSGMPVGLSPIAYAALSILQGLTAQQFTIDWYANSTVPSGILRNSAKDLTRQQAQDAKNAYKAAVSNGDIWVTGSAWEFHPMVAAKNDQNFLEASRATLPDIARYMGVPADLIDAMVSGGSSITYANIVQRNLQFLIMHFGPVIARRESAITRNLLRPGLYAKFNSDALLRLDPAQVSQMFGQQVRDRLRAPSEVRDLWNLPPFTPEQLAEFERLQPSQTTDLARALQQLYLSVGKVISSDEARTIANDLYGADLPVPGPAFDIGGTS